MKKTKPDRYKCVAAIVTYQNPEEMIRRAVESFLNTKLKVKLYVIDNSPEPVLEKALKGIPVKYCFMGSNLGFGAANNYAIRNSEPCDYFLALNPDVFFECGNLEKLISYMDSSHDVGLVMPKILYADGRTQYLCKLLPTPLDLILRRFGLLKKWVEMCNYRFEMRFADYNRIMEVPFLSGCFMLIKNDVFEKVGMFDERFFLYWEDTDLSRRIGRYYKTVYYPKAQIYHEYTRGSYRNLKLCLYQVVSIFKYFNKWGWVFDIERVKINKKVVSLYSKSSQSDV